MNAFGPTWFQSIGPDEMPGSMLVTVSGGVAHPGLYEIEVGAKIGDVIRGAGGAPQGVGGVLVGGYSGTWLAAETAATVPLQPSGLAAVGGIVGAGVVAVVPGDACGWTERRTSCVGSRDRPRASAGPACTASRPSPGLPNRSWPDAAAT